MPDNLAVTDKLFVQMLLNVADISFPSLWDLTLFIMCSFQLSSFFSCLAGEKLNYSVQDVASKKNGIFYNEIAWNAFAV